MNSNMIVDPYRLLRNLGSIFPNSLGPARVPIKVGSKSFESEVNLQKHVAISSKSFT